MGRSDVIVNVRVVNGTGGGLSGFAQYLGTRKGAMTQPSEDDIWLGKAMSVQRFASYLGERPGAVSFEEDNCCALFDADGAVSVKEASAQFASIRGNAITMTISVRNEDAEAFALESRESWQRLARAGLDRYAAKTGVIAPHDTRWIAAVHVNGKSHHLHAVVWDASGRFNSLIPKRRLVSANEDMRQMALAPALATAERRRTLARNELVEALKTPGVLPFQEFDGIREALPVEGRMSYAHLERCHPTAAETVLAATARIVASDPPLAAKRSEFADAAAMCAKLQGLKGANAEERVKNALTDLDKRCCNAVIAAVKEAVPSVNSAGIGEAEMGADLRQDMPSLGAGLANSKETFASPEGSFGSVCGGNDQRKRKKRRKRSPIIGM